jgi:hypothetical protein
MYKIRNCIASLVGLVVLLPHAAIANADSQDPYRGDPIYDAAVNAAQQLKPQCRMIGQAMIQMAIPRPGMPDAVREQRVENTAGHIPDGCLINN